MGVHGEEVTVAEERLDGALWNAFESTRHSVLSATVVVVHA